MKILFLPILLMVQHRFKPCLNSIVKTIHINIIKIVIIKALTFEINFVNKRFFRNRNSV